MSDMFSAGQYWCCFELIAEDGALLICAFASRSTRICVMLLTKRTRLNVKLQPCFSFRIQNSVFDLLGCSLSKSPVLHGLQGFVHYTC